MAVATLLVVRDRDGDMVHCLDVTSRTEGEREKIERGMLRQMSPDYTVGIEVTGEDGRLPEPEPDTSPLEPREALEEIAALVRKADAHPDGAWRGHVLSHEITAVFARLAPDNSLGWEG